MNYALRFHCKRKEMGNPAYCWAKKVRTPLLDHEIQDRNKGISEGQREDLNAGLNMFVFQTHDKIESTPTARQQLKGVDHSQLSFFQLAGQKQRGQHFLGSENVQCKQ